MKFKEVPTAVGPLNSMDDIKKMGKGGKEAKRLYKEGKKDAANKIYTNLEWVAFSLSWGDELLEHAKNKSFLNKLEDFLKGIKTASPEELQKRRGKDESTLKNILGKLEMNIPFPKTPGERRALYDDIKSKRRELKDKIYKKLKPKLNGSKMEIEI